MLIDQGDDLLIDLTDQNHLHNVQGFLIGHPHAAHVAARDSQFVEELVDLRPAAVHHHGINADVFQENDVLGEAFLQLLVHHGVAAVLDDEGLAIEALKIGKRFHQHLCFADEVLHVNALA